MFKLCVRVILWRRCDMLWTSSFVDGVCVCACGIGERISGGALWSGQRGGAYSGDAAWKTARRTVSLRDHHSSRQQRQRATRWTATALPPSRSVLRIWHHIGGAAQSPGAVVLFKAKFHGSSFLVWLMWHNSRTFARLPVHLQLAALGKLLTRMFLCHQAVWFGTGRWAVMLFSWECNRRLGGK